MIDLARTSEIRPQIQLLVPDDATPIYDRMRSGLLTGRAVVVPT